MNNPLPPGPRSVRGGEELTSPPSFKPAKVDTTDLKEYLFVYYIELFTSGNYSEYSVARSIERAKEATEKALEAFKSI